MRQTYKDRDGRLLGWTDQAGARTTGRDRDGRLVGWYDIVRNETRDQNGRLIGHGNLLSALIL
jgi:YD repeat-containing protein